MKTSKIRASLVIFLLTFSASTFGLSGVGVEYDKRDDFSKYKTYAWRQGTPAPDPEMQHQIQNAIEHQLASKGLTKAGSAPDLYVITHTLTGVEQRVDVRQLGYSGFLWRRRGGWYAPTTRVYYIPIGTFRVDLVDRVSSKPVWRGLATEYLSDDREKNGKRINKIAKDIFKKFQPQK